MKVDFEKALEVARAQVALNVREKERNWGGQITHYLAAAGIKFPAPWCAAFLVYCLRQAGGCPWSELNHPAHVPAIWKWAESKGIARLKAGYAPKPGDLIVFSSGRELAHIGMVERFAGGVVETIEGNTSSGTNTGEGDGLYRRKHAVSSSWVYGFISWPATAPRDPESVTVTHAGQVLAVGRTENGRTVAAIAPIVERLGYQVVWDSETRTADIQLKKG